MFKLLWLSSFLLPAMLPAAEPESSEAAAGKLVASTVTVRILPAKGAGYGYKAVADDAQRADADSSDSTRSEQQGSESNEGVTVCSGVCVGKGLIVTFGHNVAQPTPLTSRFRITLPAGEQAAASLRVLDHYSGLSLLESEDGSLTALEPAGALPAIGGTVLTAAAAGIEQPVVSRGILSAIDRSIGGVGLPPLLECDVRTTDTSSGAALVDGAGKLIGIIVATSLPGERAGWSYAVPVRHVQRLIDARSGKRIIVIERRRPTVGLTLGPGSKEGTVEVERVTPGGPADKAGIRPGDLILEADGRKLRSAYQAVDLIMTRQPGEKIAFVCQQQDERATREVTLGGAAGAAVANTSEAQPYQQARVGPQLNVRVVGPNQIEVRNGGDVAELGIAGENRPRRSPGDELGMLKLQLGAFEKVILRLQGEVENREQQQAKNAETIESLRREVEKLRQELGAKK